MKKKAAILLFVMFVLTLLTSCTGVNTPSIKKDPFESLTNKTGKEVLVGVILNEVNENTNVIKDYLNNEIGPKLNMKFDFSEVLKNEDARVTFIENEFVKGAVGIINLDTSAAKSVIETCQRLGMYVHNQKSAFSDENPKATAALGNAGASSIGMQVAYKEAMDELLNDGELHNVLIYSCAATGKQAESHYYSTVAVLQAMQEKYDLTYDRTIDEIAQSADVGPLVTGRNDIKIYIVSGNIRTNIISALETGIYDIYACVAGYEEDANAVDAVEKAKNMDIKIIATASIEARTAIGFSEKDSLGNNILNYAVINPLTVAFAINAAAIRNAVDGYADMYKVDGKAVQLFVDPWLCASAEDYVGLALLDKTGTWVISGDEAKMLCKSFNDQATLQTSIDLLESVSDSEALIARKIQ